MECYCYLRNIQDRLSDGKTPYERRFGEPFKGPIIPIGFLVEYHSTSPRDQSRIHLFGKKVLPGIFLGYVLYERGLWKGDTQVADLEELEKMDASGVHVKRLNAKEVILPKGGEEFIFLVADGTVKPFGKIRHWKSPPWFGIIQFEETVIMTSYENHKGFRLHNIFKTHIRMPAKHEMISGPSLDTSYTAITLNHESNFARRERNHFLFHWKFYWRHQGYSYCLRCIAGKPHRWLLEHWWVKRFVRLMDRFHTFSLIEGKASRRIHVVRGEIDQTASNIKAWFNCGQKIWRSKSRNSKMKEKQNWASDKPVLENARRLRGICFIEPEDEEFKEILKNARTKLEVPASPAVPCKSVKSRKYGATRSKNDDHKSKLTCILEAEESKRLRMEGTAPKIHEDHIAGKESHSLQHFHLGHKLIPMPQAMKILEAQAAVEK